MSKPKFNLSPEIVDRLKGFDGPEFRVALINTPPMTETAMKDITVHFSGAVDRPKDAMTICLNWALQTEQ